VRLHCCANHAQLSSSSSAPKRAIRHQTSLKVAFILDATSPVLSPLGQDPVRNQLASACLKLTSPHLPNGGNKFRYPHRHVTACTNVHRVCAAHPSVEAPLARTTSDRERRIEQPCRPCLSLTRGRHPQQSLACLVRTRAFSSSRR
jgi:hypothetical protein